MSFQLSWKIEGRQELSRNLRGISETMGNWQPAFRKAAKELKDIFSNDVFATRGKAINENWKPLKPSYLAAKRRQGYPPDPLIKTGKMQKSFKSLAKTDHAEVWNAIAYAKYHQSNKPRKKLPRRAMLKLGNDQKALVVRIFNTHFQKKLK